MPRPLKYVILDTFYSDAVGTEVMVYGPCTEAKGSQALVQELQKIRKSERTRDLRLRAEHVPGLSVTVKDGLGIVRELKMQMLHRRLL